MHNCEINLILDRVISNCDDLTKFRETESISPASLRRALFNNVGWAEVEKIRMVVQHTIQYKLRGSHLTEKSLILDHWKASEVIPIF